MKTLRKKILHSFTLIELLIVMAIIAILTALTLGAAGAIQNKAARSRAAAEIAAMSTALESYKLDNGIYPACTTFTMSTYAPTSYTASGTVLYTNLSGKASFSATTLSSKMYMAFKNSQVNTSSSSVQDPFGYTYGYSTSTNCVNSGFFDLWSTSGKTDKASSTNGVWVTNWSAN